MKYECRRLDGYAEYEACFRLQEETWGEGFSGAVSPVLQMITDKMGGVVSGAFDDEEVMVGFVIGMTGLFRGRLAHWSHMLAVRPEKGGRGVGRALKFHQRERCLESGIEEVYWTYDPLESRNAHLNLNRLGARAEEYSQDVYPTSESPRHRLGTDRFLVRWPLRDAEVERRASGERIESLPEPSTPAAHRKRTPLGVPSPEGLRDSPRLRIRIPEEIEKVKAQSMEAGLQWRRYTRKAFRRYLGRGYRVAGFRRDPDDHQCRCYYIVAK